MVTWEEWWVGMGFPRGDFKISQRTTAAFMRCFNVITSNGLWTNNSLIETAI
jgi:hypothetical protein